MRRRTTLISLAAVALGVSACGTGSDEASPDATQTATPTEAPSDETPSDDAADGGGAGDEAEAAEAANPAEVADTAATDDTAVEQPADDPTDEIMDEAAGEGDPAADEAADGAVVDEPAPAPLGGRTFSSTLEPESDFDGNPFPDLVVKDVTRDQDVNIANIFPADRPVVIWGWAPH